MLRNCMLAVVLAAAMTCYPALGADPVLPKIDKAKLEAFIRYTEGYTPLVKIVIDDPTVSPFSGFSRVAVHMSLGEKQRIEKVYFVSSDGKQFVNGTLWNLNESPFLDTLLHLPADGPSFGPADAKITMLVFSDFQCPYCREFARTMRNELPKKYPNDVRVIYKDFPIEAIHPWAFAAAEASHCIGDNRLGPFWAYHDWIFEHQEEVNAGNLREKTMAFAATQGLDASAVGACLDSHAKAEEVRASLKAGEGLGIQQTPTFFLNGRLVSGALPWKNLDLVIQLELNRPKEVPGPPSVRSFETKPGS
ncbi:MAG: DsbA family protein [Acidobacteriaceae bacterium]|nr:DsbA family protein [Acidobacteriaceae bacterium]